MLPLLAITADPLDPAALAAAVSGPAAGDDEGTGGIASFVGVVRNRHLGRRVLFLHYEAYEPLALRTFERIAAEASGQWPQVRLGLHHRVGRLAIGEASVAIAAAGPHRAEAFAACRFAIERVKQIAPIWKREYFEGGEAWVEGATADPDDEGARAAAYSAAGVP